jgi:hypothetical protein
MLVDKVSTRALVPLGRTSTAVLLALALCFGLGFSDAGESRLWLTTFLHLVAISAVAAACIYLGRSEERPYATVGALVLGPASLIIWLYGAYAAHLSGWRGLDESEFGTDDLRGHVYIWARLLFNPWIPAIPALLCFAITRVAARFAPRERRDMGSP